MHLHFGTQSLNVHFSIEKPQKKARELTVLMRPAIFFFFKTFMVETIEINETDSRIQTSCPKFYLKLLDGIRLGLLLTISDSTLGLQRPVHHVATDEEHRCGRK